MDFINHTAFLCRLQRLDLRYRDLLQATLIVKGTFDVLPDETLQASGEPIPILEEDTDTPFGSVEHELMPIKAWCDVALLGHAYTPHPDRPAAQTRVELSIGAFRRSVHVTGDRFWLSSAFGYKPSQPIPFWQLPLSYENAFGGHARMGEGLAQCVENPHGRGFILDAAHVEGTALPNLEEPDQLIASWSDRPLPAGFAPLSRHSSLRAQRGIRLEGADRLVRMDPSSFCSAHSRMQLPQYPAGQRVIVDGARPDGRWTFQLPRFAPTAELELGGQHYALPVTADTLYLLPDERRLIVVGRRSFVYHFVPERLRCVQLRDAPARSQQRQATSIRVARAGGQGIAIELEEDVEPFSLPAEHLERLNPLCELTETLPLCVSG